MYLIIDASNLPIAITNNLVLADQWCKLYGWTHTTVIDATFLKPRYCVTGFVNLLEPGCPVAYGQKVISFDPNGSFIDASSMVLGARLHRANLENQFFSMPEGFDPQKEAIQFWHDLHARSLDIKRISANEFSVVGFAKNVDVESSAGVATTGTESLSLKPINRPVEIVEIAGPGPSLNLGDMPAD